jgi:hypothetical protein
VKHCYGGKAINITYCECVFVALGMQHALSMGRVTLSSVARAAVHYFSTSHKQQDFRKKDNVRKMCFEFLNNFCLEHFSF